MQGWTMPRILKDIAAQGTELWAMIPIAATLALCALAAISLAS